MRDVSRTGSVTQSARTVGGGAGSFVIAARRESPRTFLQRWTGRCTRYRSAERSALVTVWRTLAARNAARYSKL